jgi:cytochrome c-type biogenesis protein CcmH
MSIAAILALALTIPGMPGAADVEQEARTLEAMLIAPCCFTQQVSIHRSEAAEEVRRDVRRRLAAGETREAILAAYVQQYGAQILAEPPADGFSALLYLLPPIGFALSAGLVFAFVRRFASRGTLASQPPVTAPPGVEDRYAAELDEALRDLD